ncbi:MAG: hypothetical protein HC894_24375 [Microcoleus sp. SM1_3_4]|nr:hypothetical protein [Microcoleus sp. SM1_3_4]
MRRLFVRNCSECNRSTAVKPMAGGKSIDCYGRSFNSFPDRSIAASMSFAKSGKASMSKQ